jgi:hypothetical protein
MNFKMNSINQKNSSAVIFLFYNLNNVNFTTHTFRGEHKRL